MSTTPPTTTVILGAGIIGLSTAYYLSLQARDNQEITILDASPIPFSSASGFAGGFLARDWFSPAVTPLGALSFDEHRRLAAEHDGATRWGYTTSTSVSYLDARAAAAAREDEERGDDWLRDGTSRANAAPPVELESGSQRAPAWLTREDGDRMEIIGTEGSTAQVDPLLLCRFLLEQCEKAGVRVSHGVRVSGVVTDGDDRLAGLRVVSAQGTEVEMSCTRLVLATGVWTGAVFRTLFPGSTVNLGVSSLAGHSLVLRSPRWDEKAAAAAGCHAVFTTGDGFCPEMFSRRSGHIYFAGLNSAELPVQEAGKGYAVPQAEALAVLRERARKMLGKAKIDDLEVVREGLCFRPVTSWGTPIVSRVRDVDLGEGTGTVEGGGVYVATGHGPWGISISLGTGLVLAEMIRGLPTSVDISGLALRPGNSAL